MAFINRGGFLMGKNGLAFSKNCCCKALNCYCYVHSRLYGSQILERRVVCYAAPQWDGSKYVYPDGQPCVPAGSRCTVIFEGNVVKSCGCNVSNDGESRNWTLLAGNATSSTSCTTISPPP